VLEAAQFGVPAVCFRHATGMESFIGAGCGAVIEERTATAAAAVIGQLAQSSQLRKEYGAAAKEKVHQNYIPAVQMPLILSKIHSIGMDPGVSIILPNYNHEKFLNQRIDSILNQSYQDFELLILDDNSTDGSSKIIEP